MTVERRDRRFDMSERQQFLACSTCGGGFVGEPEPVGLDFCSDECRDAWWAEQEKKDEKEKQYESQAAE
jgi:hypothetical protein